MTSLIFNNSYTLPEKAPYAQVEYLRTSFNIEPIEDGRKKELRDKETLHNHTTDQKVFGYTSAETLRTKVDSIVGSDVYPNGFTSSSGLPSQALLEYKRRHLYLTMLSKWDEFTSAIGVPESSHYYLSFRESFSELWKYVSGSDNKPLVASISLVDSVVSVRKWRDWNSIQARVYKDVLSQVAEESITEAGYLKLSNIIKSAGIEVLPFEHDENEEV